MAFVVYITLRTALLSQKMENKIFFKPNGERRYMKIENLAEWILECFNEIVI